MCELIFDFHIFIEGHWREDLLPVNGAVHSFFSPLQAQTLGALGGSWVTLGVFPSSQTGTGQLQGVTWLIMAAYLVQRLKEGTTAARPLMVKDTASTSALAQAFLRKVASLLPSWPWQPMCALLSDEIMSVKFYCHMVIFYSIPHL